MRSFVASAVLLLASVSGAQGDVTLRYSMTMEPGPALPPQAVDKVKDQVKAFDSGTTLQIKGDRARAVGMGSSSITDFKTGTITMLDEKGKRYAKATQTQFLEAVASQSLRKSAEMDKAAAGLKMDTTATKTGRNRDIRGMKATETEIVLKMQLPGVPVEMRTTLSVWSPAAGASEDNAALRELEAYAKRAWAGTNMMGSMRTMMEAMPGGGESMAKFIESMKEVGLMLEMNGTVAMPGVGEMVRRMNPGAAGAPPDGAGDVMFLMTQKLDEFSTENLSDSLFLVPSDYKQVPLKEIVTSLIPKAQ